MNALHAALPLLCALAACAPPAPPAAEPPAVGPPAVAAPVAEAAQRRVDYTVTTVPNLSQQRFLIEFASLTERGLCANADYWPTAEGLFGYNRSPRIEGEMVRFEPRATRDAFVRFDQFSPAVLDGDGARYIDLDPKPVFCESGATP